MLGKVYLCSPPAHEGRYSPKPVIQNVGWAICPETSEQLLQGKGKAEVPPALWVKSGLRKPHKHNPSPGERRAPSGTSLDLIPEEKVNNHVRKATRCGYPGRFSSRTSQPWHKAEFGAAVFRETRTEGKSFREVDLHVFWKLWLPGGHLEVILKPEGHGGAHRLSTSMPSCPALLLVEWKTQLGAQLAKGAILSLGTEGPEKDGPYFLGCFCSAGGFKDSRELVGPK